MGEANCASGTRTQHVIADHYIAASGAEASLTPAMTPLTQNELMVACKAAISSLAKNGFNPCLIGSLAARFYGAEHRFPKDVDILIHDSFGQTIEDIKDMTVADDSRFFLVKSKVPMGKHRVLWYNLEDNPSRAPSATAPSPAKACKIDILIPSELLLAQLPEDTFQHASSGYSYPPYLLLVLLKLRAWKDHYSLSAPLHMQNRVPDDEADLDELLRLGRQMTRDEMGWGTTSSSDFIVGNLGEATWLLGGFESVDALLRCVKDYTKRQPKSSLQWQRIGIL